MCRYKEILIISFVFLIKFSYGQKLSFDTSMYADWPSLAAPVLSDDGRYIKYDVVSGNVGDGNSQTIKTVVQSTFNKWKLEFPFRIDGFIIAKDSKRALFLKSGDSLMLLDLGTDLVRCIARTRYFQLQMHKNDERLVYKPLDDPKTLILRDLKTSAEKKYKNVNAWKFSRDGSILILLNSNNNSAVQLINWVDMDNGEVYKIHEGEHYQMNNLIIDSKHKQIVFGIETSIWLYKFVDKIATCIISKDNGEKIGYSRIKNFSKDGRRLFVTLKEKSDSISINENKIVEVWSYLDKILPSEAKARVFDKEYLGIVNLKNGQLVQLQKKSGDQLFFPSSNLGSDTLALMLHREALNESWSISYNWSYSLISTIDNHEQPLEFLNNKKCVSLSPTGKFLIYYDFDINAYLSYEISNGKIRNLTKQLETCWIDSVWNDGPTNIFYPRDWTKLLWTKDDNSVLVYDQFDIWKLDPINDLKPINVTNGYGQKHRIVFNLAFDDYQINIIRKNEELILSAFDLDNKDNGYFKKNIIAKGDPKILTMGPYLFDIKQTSGYLPSGSSFNPVKARYAKKYVVRRMQASEFPNYLLTSDFKNFRTLTDLHPEKNYNWYTAELHSWKSLNGKVLQGILYKPENFDSSKKYPIIFHYYQRKSEGLNVYLKPKVLENWLDINIPTYVNAGYLVFSPDIYYETGNPMQGAYEAVVSAAQYIAQFPFVNSSKMGIQGGSFGGLQTNYLITRTDLFAAAVSSAGVSDLVSGYGTLSQGRWSQQNFYEEGQFRMGGSLWERVDAYIKSSPIFMIHRITTPLLIMHGTDDQACSFSNVVEFFTGLRRMGKKVWMLVYPKAGHGVAGKQGNDFSIRMMQFFDHYLKEKPLPIWMSKGLDRSNDALLKSCQYDSSLRTSGNGLLIPKEQAKVDSLMMRKPITLTLN